jgi:dipeptidyl aminopeptidase/acylaminoacyl peptidase
LSALPLRRSDVPPVISIHGDADPVVPYTQSIRLHQALKTSSVSEEMITIAGGKHGGFTRAENERALAAIDAFLTKVGIPPR